MMDSDWDEAQSGEKRKRPQKSKSQQVCEEIMLGIWLLLLIVACILHWVAFMHVDGWLKHATTKSRVSLHANYRTHKAWFAAYVLLWMSQIAITITAVFALLYYVNRHRKYSDFRTKCFKGTMYSAIFTMLCMFIALVVWPIGLKNPTAAPCSVRGVDERAYHTCAPWKGGPSVIIMIISQILLTLIVAWMSCLPVGWSFGGVGKKKEDEEEQPWDELFGDGVAETSMDGGAVVLTNAGYIDTPGAGGATVVANDGYIDTPGAASTAVLVNDGYLETDGVPGSSSVIANDAYIDAEPAWPAPARPSTFSVADDEDDMGDNYLVIEQSGQHTVETRIDAAANSAAITDAYLDVGDDAQTAAPPAISDAYLDIEEPSAPVAQGSKPVHDADTTISDAYLDIEEPSQPRAVPVVSGDVTISDAYLDVGEPSVAPDNTISDAYLDIEEPTPVAQQTAVASSDIDISDAYLDIEEPQAPRTQEAEPVYGADTTISDAYLDIDEPVVEEPKKQQLVKGGAISAMFGDEIDDSYFEPDGDDGDFELGEDDDGDTFVLGEDEDGETFVLGEDDDEEGATFVLGED
eukprot:m.311818 g.311818  ORF g.311818 m.311818 type:complete len:577 (+) comp15961_c6_seq1:140-1870(+)